MTSQKTSLVPRIISASLLGALTLVASVAQSANINWGAPTQISGAGDVSTNGTLVGAFNVGGTGVPSTVVNGVTFQSFATTGGNGSSGNFTTVGSGFVGQSNTSGGSASAPFSALPAVYQTLLQSYSTPFGGMITMTISGLTIGAQYQFQLWSNLSSDSFNYQLTATAGNSVTLDSNSARAAGGLGQWVIGSFTADATAQTITFAGDGDGGALNAFQLRQLQPTQGVPDTGSTLAFLGLAMSGMAVARRKLRA
jgi:hypothetical protein